MSSTCLGWVVSVPLLLVACGAPLPESPPMQASGATALTAPRYKAVLIAGTGNLPVWDNAVDAVAARLRKRGTAANDIQRLSAAPAVVAYGGARSATSDNVFDAIGSMNPGPGQGCLVFATSNGNPGGLRLSMSVAPLSPFELDRALVRGCGGAPTVVIMSGCFSGVFARAPVTRANRVVLTASRFDRQSFGCSPGRIYTNYDTCLLQGLDVGGTWPQAYVAIHNCVVAKELSFAASEPQAWFGPEVADLALPVAMRDDLRSDARQKAFPDTH
jgi:hypothetical protein